MAFVNHVAIPAVDVDESADFYIDWLRGTRVPSPRFGIPVSWVLIDTVEIHLVQHPHEEVSQGYHFAVCINDVDHFEHVFVKAGNANRFERNKFGHHIVERLDGVVQMYLSDPADNVVECMFPDMDSLPDHIRAEVRRWHDYNSHDTWNHLQTAPTSSADPVLDSRARLLSTRGPRS